jgi:hypothetical protein
MCGQHTPGYAQRFLRVVGAIVSLLLIAAMQLATLTERASAQHPPGPQQTKTNVTSMPNPSVAGQSVTFSAAVSCTTCHQGDTTKFPTGNVQFSSGGAAFGTAPLIGTGAGTSSASLNYPGLSVGLQTITAVFTSTSDTSQASQGSTQQTVKGTTHDFNGDGKSDILWRDTSGNVAIWEMNGTSVLNANATFVGGVSTVWSIVGTGDFNGDGKSDILWRDTSGNVAIWEMNGTSLLNPNATFVGGVSTAWSIVGSGDFNGDGKSDILWRDTSGNVAIWEMNGTSLLNPNATFVGGVSTIWRIQDPLGQ